jgi:hypothetical protein
MLLRRMIGQAVPEPLTVRLYINPRDPTPEDTAGDFLELDGRGYGPITLEPGDWRVVEGADWQRLEAVACVWTFRAGAVPARVHGYYVTGARSGRLYWAERCWPEAEAPVIGRDGQRLRIIPQVALAPMEGEG